MAEKKKKSLKESKENKLRLNPQTVTGSFPKYSIPLSGLSSIDHYSLTENQQKINEYKSKKGLLRAYKNNAITSACIDFIAKVAAKTDFHVKRVVSKDGKIEVLNDHEFLSVLYNPSQHTTKSKLLQRIFTDYLVFGESFLKYITINERGNERLIGLEPLSVVKTSVDVDHLQKTGMVRYIYSPGENRNDEIFTTDQIFHFINPSSESLIFPYTPNMSIAKQNFLLDQISNNQAGAFLGGNLIPHFYLKMSEEVSISNNKEIEQRKIEAIQRQLKSLSGNGSEINIPVVYGELNSLKLSPNEIDYTRTEEKAEAIIQKRFGVSDFFLGKAPDINRATAKELYRSLNEHVITPIIVAFEEACQQKIMQRWYSFDEVFSHDDVNPAETEDKVNTYLPLFEAGAITKEGLLTLVGVDLDFIDTSDDEGNEIGESERFNKIKRDENTKVFRNAIHASKYLSMKESTREKAIEKIKKKLEKTDKKKSKITASS